MTRWSLHRTIGGSGRRRISLVGAASAGLLLSAALASAAHAAPASTTSPPAPGQEITELIVAYAPGVNPSEAPGVATGSSDVAGADL